MFRFNLRRFTRGVASLSAALQKYKKAPGLCCHVGIEHYSSKSRGRLPSPGRTQQRPVVASPSHSISPQVTTKVGTPDYDFSTITFPFINDPATWSSLSQLIALLEDDAIFWDFNNVLLKHKEMITKIKAFKRFVGLVNVKIFTVGILNLNDQLMNDLRNEGCILIQVAPGQDIADMWIAWLMSLWGTRRLKLGPWSGDLHHLPLTTLSSLTFRPLHPLILQRKLKVAVFSGDHYYADILNALPRSLVTSYVVSSYRKLSKELLNAGEVIGYAEQL